MPRKRPTEYTWEYLGYTITATRLSSYLWGVTITAGINTHTLDRAYRKVTDARRAGEAFVEWAIDRNDGNVA